MALLALSLSSGVEKIGSYAGLAAVLGLAVLSLLYFAQAREVKRLREWAGGAPERARREEERVAAEAEARLTTPPTGAARVVAQPRPATAAGTAATAAPAAAAATAATSVTPVPPRPSPVPASAHAPAGMAAPALASATRFPALIPSGPSPAATPNGAPETPAPAPATPDPAVPVALTAAASTRRRPSTSPLVGNGRADAPPPPVAPPAQGPPAQPPAAAPLPGPAAPLRAERPSATIPPRPSTIPPQRSSRPRAWAIAGLIAGLLALAGGVFALTQIIGGSDNGTPTNSRRASATRGAKGNPGKPFSRGTITVAVLNGTPVAGLASQVADQLGADGFKQGAVTNASDQARAATIVSYFPGHRADALKVRRALKAGSTQPIDATTQGIVCPSGASCDAKVVVTVGSDLPSH